MNIFQRSHRLLHSMNFEHVSGEIIQEPHEVDFPEDQYILRMMIKSPETNGEVLIPPELEWLRATIDGTREIQDTLFPRTQQKYIYVTVRSGLVRSVTDDEWHVDGYSSRIPLFPEQNYIWSNCYPTEVLDQQFKIPGDFNSLRYNIHQFFQDRADENLVRPLKEKHIAIIDPYIVHRRPRNIPVGTMRCFFRISYVPIEIKDDNCTQNPLMPVVKYNQQDFRKSLIRYDAV